MAFRHLEDRLADGNQEELESYLGLFERLQEPTKTVLGYTLDIASYLESQGLQKDYVLFGGYGVLSHLMANFGEEVAVTWRGSADIDMAGTRNVLTRLKSGYNIASDNPSPNLEDKRTLKLTEDSENECKIDFYTGNAREKYGEAETNEHFGIPLKVADPTKLIQGKLATLDAEETHIYDILTMLKVLEKRGLNPGEIVSQFRGIERDLLINKLRLGEKFYTDRRIGLLPPREFSEKVYRELHKRRNC